LNELETSEQNEKDFINDYTTNSFTARKGERRGRTKTEGTKRTAGIKATPPSKGMVSGGKLAGKGLTKAAESGGAAGSLFIYGLAILNDFPDIADWMLEALLAAVGGLGPIIDFLFDAVVFLGFRYFLRAHMNVSKVRLILYSATILEFIPGPLDVFPFWTLCAWMVLRQIKEEQENKQKLTAQGAGEASAKRRAGDMRRNRIQKAMGGG
jgi:hypothetical protein